MTRNLKRTGGTVLVALIATLMLLSAFAMPAAADTTAATTTVNADDVDGSEYTETATIDFESTANNDASVGEKLIIQINDANVAEGDIEITDAEVNSTNNLGSTVNDVEVEAVEDRSIHTGTTDTVVVNVTDATSPNSASGDSFTLDVSFRVNQQAAEDQGADDYSGESIIEVTEDNVGSAGGVLTDQSIVNLDIEPGSPSDISITDPNNINYDGTDSVDITALDQYGAEIVPGNTDETTLKDTQTTYQNITGIEANLTSVPNGEEDFNTTVDLELNGTDAGSGTKTVNYGDGAAEINTDPADGSATQYVGNFELQTTASGVGQSEAKAVNVQPDSITASFGSDFDADGGETTYGLAVTDGSNNLNVAELQVDLDENGGFSSGNYQGTTANGTLSEASVTDTDGDSISEITVDQGFSQNIVITDNLDDAFTFASTDAATYEIRAQLPDGAVQSPTSSDTVAVSPGAADALELDASNTTFDNGDNFGSYTVLVTDAHNNEVDDSSRYSGSSTDVSFTLTDSNGDVYDTASVTLDGSSGSPATIGDANDGNTPDLKAGVGGPFTLEVDQDSDQLSNDVASDTFTIYPDRVAISGASAHDADTNTTLDVELQDTTDDGNDGAVNNVSSFDFDLRLNTENLQTGADIAASEDLKVEIEDEGQLNASGSQQDVVVTATSGTTEVTFNSTAAGAFQLQAEAATDGQGGPATDTSSTFDVYPLAISELDAEISEEVIGAVNDDGGEASVTVTLEDEFGNAAGYSGTGDNAEDTTVNITLDESGTEVISKTIAETDSAFGASPDSAVRTYDLGEGGSTNALNPDADITNSDVGEATLNVDNPDASTVATDSDLTITHEAYDLSEGFQRISLPQPGEVATQNVDHVTTWNTSAANYDQDEVDILTGETVEGDSELHSGLFVNAKNSDARIGFDFETSEQVNVGQESLEAGWNFIGTNFDMSTQTSVPLEEDLRTVDKIENNPSTSEVVYDGGLADILDASSTGDDTSALDETYGPENGDYGTYWVYVEDPSTLDSAERQLIGPAYSPTDRTNIE